LPPGSSTGSRGDVRLLFTAFFFRRSASTDWVTYHWITASSCLDLFTSSPLLAGLGRLAGRVDLVSASKDRAAPGQSAPPPHRFAKYPRNKMYHAVIVLASLRDGDWAS
jgi:hypothetical protein